MDVREMNKEAYHDTHKTSSRNVAIFIFINLLNILVTCPDRDKHPARRCKLVNKVLGKRGCSCSNMNSVIGS